MDPPATSASSIYLKPGQFYVGRATVRVLTVLGSCVAVTMFHRDSGMAAICHALQPICPQAPHCPAGCNVRGRYAACIVSVMVQHFWAADIRQTQIETKLFGGAVIAAAGSTSPARYKAVGRQNVEAAMAAIAENGLKLKVADVGGQRGRKIIFNTIDGAVMLKRLERFQPSGDRLLREGTVVDVMDG